MKILSLKRGIIAEVLISLLTVGLLINCSLLLVSGVSEGHFSGVVYAATGVPIVNAIVSASGVNGSGYATTDSSGAYLINEGLKTGTYTVEVFATGYLAANKTGVHVTVGQTTTGTDFYLNLSGAITGKVRDSVTSNPLQGVTVFAISTGGSFAWTAETDSNGDYTIATNLVTGTYNATALNPTGYITKTASGVSVTAGATTAGVNLALDKSGMISGRITAHPSGSPLANTTVSATSGSLFGYATSNATGYYRIISGLGTGTYNVFAYYSSHGSFGFNQTSGVNVTAGLEKTNVNMEISVTPPTPSGIITGKVTDISNSNPIVGASVEANGAGFGSADTDANGNYVISEGLSTGTYNVTASAAGYNSTTIAGVSVTVNQTTPNINFQLTKIPPTQSGSISGNVRGDQGAIPEFTTPTSILLLTIAVTAAAFAFAKKKTKNK
jgi:hypothetical protein